MFHKLLLGVLCAGAVAAATVPAQAGGWSFTGPRGGTATFYHWGGPGYGGSARCCYGGAVAAGAAAGLAVGAAAGAAAAARPAYAAYPAYVAPPAVVYAAPQVIYRPGGYYYIP